MKERASQSQRKSKNPSFFKVLIKDFSTRLRIPSAFIKKVFGKDVPKKAILENYYGKSEEVELVKHENRICFCKRCSKFVEDNKLETGDFLVFKYVSDYSKFKVKIYGKSCCEKEYSEPGKNEGERNNNTVGDERKRKREEEEEHDGELKAAKRIESSDSDIGDEDSEDEPINIDSESSHRPIVEEEEVGNSKQPTSEKKGHGEGKRLHTDDNQIEFESQNPSFQVKLKSSSANNYLNIPLSFSREYIIRKERKREEITIETPDKMWEIGLLVLWAVGKKKKKKKKELAGARLTQGWRNLTSEYRLQMGDACVFELIQPTRDLVFRLHVSRQDPQNNKFIHIL